MMHLAVGLGVVLAGSAIAYYYNEKTNEEIERQNRAYRERDNIYNRYNAKRSAQDENYREQRQAQAREYKTLLLREIDKHFEKVSPITQAYQELYNAIVAEIKADTTSPYRKSALQKEFARIEDAQIRISEYAKYLEFEKTKVNQLWDKGSYDWLLERPIADALLPLEWLYPGKLLVAELDDIDKPLGNSRHILKFLGYGEQSDKQKALALSYGSEFPILIVKSNDKQNQFFGCVASGIVFHDHIRLSEPLSMTVERYRGGSKDYLCTFNDGLVKAALPQQSLLQPGIRCIPGQSIDVYFDSYSATLDSNPLRSFESKSKKPWPSITEKPPSIMGYDEFEIFIEADTDALKKIPSSSSFYSESTHWSLLDFDANTNLITLGKGEVEAQCKLSENNDGLIISKILVHELPKVGIDLPFEFILLSSDLSASELFGWVYGLEQLLSFASQAFINSTTSKERIKQVEFFRRWEKVVEYQKQQESIRSIEFEITPVQIKDSYYLLNIGNEFIKQSRVNDKSAYQIMREIENSGFLQFNRSCRLLIWDAENGKYIPAVKQSHRIRYQLENGEIEIEAPLNNFKKLDFTQPHKFQLVVQLPNAPLQRQQMALDALFEDRIVEPMLKDIFLAPSSYIAEHQQYWLESDIHWSGRLTESQKHAVKVALAAKHIAMIQGPPGTGKTTTIVEMLFQLLQKNPNQKILVVSQQNTAVDNAITKFKKFYPKLVNTNVNIVRVGNPDKIDDDMTQDHFDLIFQNFIDKCLSDTTTRFSLFDANEDGEYKALNNTAKLDALHEWRALLMQIKDSATDSKVSDEFFTTMLANKNLIGATCVGLAARHSGIDHITFDVAIVDEAGRATVPELLIPLLRSRKAILIGDHHQLPPSIAPVLREDSAKEEMKFLEETFLETSFFEALFEQLPKDCTAALTEQFRMSKPIGNLVAELFYTKDGERRLFNGNKDPLDTNGFVSKDCLTWVDVWGKQLKQQGSTSLENQLEAEAICSYLEELSESFTRKIDVAVITPYGAQKRLIRKLLKTSKGSQQVKLGSLNIKIDTVDSFQGSEAELVCYSTVRTHGSMQFLLDKKRLNVACSRAKENLVFFGNIRALENWKPKTGEVNLFKEIIERSKREKYIPARSEKKKIFKSSRINKNIA